MQALRSVEEDEAEEPWSYARPDEDDVSGSDVWYGHDVSSHALVHPDSPLGAQTVRRVRFVDDTLGDDIAERCAPESPVEELSSVQLSKGGQFVFERLQRQLATMAIDERIAKITTMLDDAPMLSRLADGAGSPIDEIRRVLLNFSEEYENEEAEITFDYWLWPVIPEDAHSSDVQTLLDKFETADREREVMSAFEEYKHLFDDDDDGEIYDKWESYTMSRTSEAERRNYLESMNEFRWSCLSGRRFIYREHPGS